jgi:2'-5' RNA ligase
VIVVGEAESIVGVHRSRHDPMASRGVPAHVTVLFPFRSAVDDEVKHDIATICAGLSRFTATFAEVDSFSGGAVWLKPEPEDEFAGLLRAVHIAFPDCPPYGGQYDSVIPHLTVAQHLLGREAAELAGTLRSHLPFTSAVDELTLLTEDDEMNWHCAHTWPLA